SLQAALRLPGAASPARHAAEGWLAAFEGREHHQDGTAGEPEARLLWFTGAALYRDGESEAGRGRVEEALAHARKVGDRWTEAAALAERAGHRLDDGDVPASRADARHSAEIFRELADRWGLLRAHAPLRSEEHTSELQSRENLVCRLLLEKKKKKKNKNPRISHIVS